MKSNDTPNRKANAMKTTADLIITTEGFNATTAQVDQNTVAGAQFISDHVARGAVGFACMASQVGAVISKAQDMGLTVQVVMAEPAKPADTRTATQIMDNAKANQCHFYTQEDVARLAQCAPFIPVLVRCGANRYVVEARKVADMVADVEAAGDYVRDLSIPV